MPINQFLTKCSAELVNSIALDMEKDIHELCVKEIDFYGYAIAPSDYWRSHSLDIGSCFNAESDISEENVNDPYFRYSVNEWQNWTEGGFEASNKEISKCLEGFRSLDQFEADEEIMNEHIEQFINMVHGAILSAFKRLRDANVFKSPEPFLCVWTPYDMYDIVEQSVSELNSSNVAEVFRKEFCV